MFSTGVLTGFGLTPLSLPNARPRRPSILELNICEDAELAHSTACPSTRILPRSEEHTSELQSPCNLVCRLLLEKKNFCIPLTTLAVLRRLPCLRRLLSSVSGSVYITLSRPPDKRVVRLLAPFCSAAADLPLALR